MRRIFIGYESRRASRLNYSQIRIVLTSRERSLATGRNGSIAVADLLSENVLTYFRLVFFSR
jgi:hypothetical protein